MLANSQAASPSGYVVHSMYAHPTTNSNMHQKIEPSHLDICTALLQLASCPTERVAESMPKVEGAKESNTPPPESKESPSGTQHQSPEPSFATYESMSLDLDDPSSPPSTSSKSSSRRSSISKAGHVKRPMNSFMLFGRHHRANIQKLNPGKDNKAISKMLGNMWLCLSRQERQQYIDKAKQLAEQHKLAHPDWKFTRNTKKKRQQKAQEEAAQSTTPSGAVPLAPRIQHPPQQQPAHHMSQQMYTMPHHHLSSLPGMHGMPHLPQMHHQVPHQQYDQQHYSQAAATAAANALAAAAAAAKLGNSHSNGSPVLMNNHASNTQFYAGLQTPVATPPAQTPLSSSPSKPMAPAPQSSQNNSTVA
eukprot:Colp12_sorted_trinity150504_noHs@35961